jgi:hypothetical protein
MSTTAQFKLTGYKLFTKAKLAELIGNPQIAAKDRLTEIGKMWNQL